MIILFPYTTVGDLQSLAVSEEKEQKATVRESKDFL